MDSPALWILLAMAAAAVMYLAVSKRASEARDAETDTMRAEAEQWFQNALERGSVPRPDLGGLIIPADELPLLSEASRLFEIERRRGATHVGTRLNIGSFPVYVGRSFADQGASMKPVASGRVALTSKTLLFSGDTRTVSVPTREIIDVQVAGRDAIQISTRKRKTPFAVTVRNPILWAVAVQHAASGSISPS